MLTLPAERLRRTAQVLQPAGRRLYGFAVPAVLVAGWLTLALTHLRLPYPSDQLHYMEAASHFPEPIPGSGMTHQMTRFGLTGLTRAAMALFGYSETTYYVVPLLGGVLLLLGTYAIGAMMFSRVVGAAAAAVLLTYAPIFFDATELLPDLLATGLFTVAVAIAIAVRRERIPARPWTLLLIGFLLGWSYLVREFIVFVWPLIPVVLWPRLRTECRPLWRGLVWLALPVAVLGAAEMLVCWIVYDDPLARVRAITGHGEGPMKPATAATFQNKPRLTYLGRLWTALGGDRNSYYPAQWGIRPLLLAMIAGALARPRRLWIFVIWTASLWVPLTLLGGVLDPSAPKLRLQLVRYWFPAFPAIVLGGIVAVWLAGRYLGRRLDKTFDKRFDKRWAALVPAVVVASVAAATVFLAAGSWVGDPDIRRGSRDMSAFRSWMADNGDGVRTVWSDGRTVHVLGVFREGPFGGGQTWTARLRPLPGPGVPGPAAGDMVVLFDTEGSICGHCAQSARAALGDPVRPPPNWRQVYATPDGVLHAYLVGP